MSRSWKRIIPLIVLGGFSTLFLFQNCAPIGAYVQPTETRSSITPTPVIDKAQIKLADSTAADHYPRVLIPVDSSNVVVGADMKLVVFASIRDQLIGHQTLMVPAKELNGPKGRYVAVLDCGASAELTCTFDDSTLHLEMYLIDQAQREAEAVDQATAELFLRSKGQPPGETNPPPDTNPAPIDPGTPIGTNPPPGTTPVPIDPGQPLPIDPGTPIGTNPPPGFTPVPINPGPPPVGTNPPARPLPIDPGTPIGTNPPPGFTPVPINPGQPPIANPPAQPVPINPGTPIGTNPPAKRLPAVR